jgi:hypothetical protein
MEYYKATAKQLYQELERLQYSENNLSNRANKAIQLISTTMQLLRKAVQERGFDKEEDEIEFFKHVKPQINGHLIFYRHIFDIEAKRIAYTEEEIEHCIAEKTRHFTLFIKENLEFVYYYQNRYTHMDKQYFVRDAFRAPLPHQNTDAFHDREFTTPYDHLAAKIVAKDLFYKFLIKPLREKIDNLSPSKIKWTASKASLVELIYALQYTGSIENGNSSVKEICLLFEEIFDVKLKDVYSTYRDIQLRKGERARYLNSLADTFDKRLEESEDFK